MRIVALLVAILVSFATPLRAADDGAAARAVISAQTEAITRDDAATAYSYAAPAIQNLFPQADAFMTMVRNKYAPVYRHKSFEFGASREIAGQIEQDVHIIDADGVPWEALYTMEPQADGSLKIIGCVLKVVGQAV
ncbi:MAG: DUF4864 domain-containing protein [Proteobacteria bacterium]|nr:DUF4864 domain-containing protein [Pseudomonadota bacterium]